MEVSSRKRNKPVHETRSKKLKANISETSGLLQNVDEATTSDPVSQDAVTERHSLRGVAKGCVDPRLKAKRPCIIFGDTYPSWLAFVGQLGYIPVMVILRSDKYLSVVEQIVPEECGIWCMPDWSALIAKIPHFTGREAISFVDGRVTQQVLDLSQAMDVHIVLGTGLSRRHIRGWEQVVHKTHHSTVGGVTHSECHVVGCYLQGSSSRSPINVPTLPRHVPRDLSSVLSDVIGRGMARNAPRQRVLAVGSVVNVRPMAVRPVYHGRGWLPPNPPHRTWVLTPSVFAPRHKWMMRPLSTSEYLGVYDYPERLVPTLQPVVDDPQFPSLQPGKALLAGACAVLAELATIPMSSGILGNGGGISFSLRKRGQALRKGGQGLDEVEPDVKRVKYGNNAVAISHFPQLSEEQERILQQVDQDKRERKATKSDDAKVPVYVWTRHYMEESDFIWEESDMERLTRAMDTMRGYLVKRWKRKIFHSYLDYYYDKKGRSRSPSGAKWLATTGCGDYCWSVYGRDQYREWYQDRLEKDSLEIAAGSDAIVRAWRASWWEWEDGSRPFHWRWPEWYRSTIRDGLEVYLDGNPPAYRKPQKDEKDPKIKEAMKHKLNKVRVRRYITKGNVVSLTSFFAVPKGESDIRMVYDGTKSGLNDVMWVPRFGLPTIDTHLRSIEEGTFLADVDVGDCFLNFPLHRSLRKLAGVDLTHYFPDPNLNTVWECWHRALMGCKSSPYQAVQGMTVAEEVIRGQPQDSNNVFRWDEVRLNLPGDPNYDSSKPGVSKIRKDGRIAADLVGYVDDLRTSGCDRKEAWRAAKRTASMLNHLGLQDAPRKRRDSTRTPGAWAGSVVVTREDGVYVTADSDKWQKAKKLVDEIIKSIQQDPNKLKRKRLEEIRGFLNYVVRTYPALKPYLTGLHLTIDGWRPNRDKEGWRMTWKRLLASQETEEEEKDWDCDECEDRELFTGSLEEPLLAPVVVEAKERLGEDMVALRYLMAHPKPLPRRVRSKAGKRVIYCFGDASKSGFGFTLEIDGHVYYNYGQWNAQVDDLSSNWREARNLLDSLRRAVEDHKLRGLELYIFTDNTTAEATFWKGWSQDKLLSGIVLEMRKLEMEHDLLLHIIHVSGTRMIGQGTDGMSRADHSTGVMDGDTMEQHIPLNESAFERSTKLEKLFRTSFEELKFRFLKPKEWFDEYHAFGNFVWTPPPAAAEAVVDLLEKARHKRPESLHLVLVPRIMTGRWRRMMTRTADYYFKIDWADCWDRKVYHEPLLCFVCLPFSISDPKLHDRKTLLDKMGGVLLQSELRKKNYAERWNLLRELFVEARSLCPLPSSVLC